MTAIKQGSAISNQSTDVLHLASGDLWAGAEVMLYTLVKTLGNDLNIKASVILLNHGMLEQKLLDCGTPVYVLDESRLNAIQILQQLNKIIKDLKPKVIHTHGIKDNILGSTAAFINQRIPSIYTVHGASEHKPPLHKFHKRLILFLNWFVSRYYQRYVIAVSAALAKKLEHDFPIGKIRIIENGIDTGALTQYNSSEDKKNTGDIYRIGIAGRLVPVKRIDLFIECALYLKKKHPKLPIHFYIYGDGPLRDELHAKVQSKNASDYIHFAGHCENIAQELLTLDVLLMTSDHEGLPMVLLEAMCLKTPIITHAVGGIPHLLEDGRYGTLLYDNTPKVFAEAIIKLIEHPESFQQLAQRAFEHVKQSYSARSTTEDYLNIYKKVSSD